MANSTVVLLLFVSCSFCWWITNGQSSCDVVLIDGTTSSHHASGLYQQQADTCNSRPIFKQINGAMYLFYIIDTVNDISAWLAGPASCVDNGAVIAFDDVGHPADVTEDWIEYDVDNDAMFDDDDWFINSNLRVTCSSLVYTGCQYVRLSGTAYNDDLEGTYTVLSSSDICYGKFSYSRSSTEYLYYYTGGWVVSQYLCHELVFMEVQDGALYPYDVTGSWIEHTTAGSITGNSDVRCTTAPPSSTTPLPSRTTPTQLPSRTTPLLSRTTPPINGQSSCDVVLIDGTTSSHHASGLYQQQTDTCNSRPVFKQINGAMYLFYIVDTVNDISAWLAGPASCVDNGALIAVDDVGHPADVTEDWIEHDVDNDAMFDDEDWFINSNLRVTCSSLAYTGCQYVRLSGTDYNDDLEGTYTVLSSSDICYGKFSYSRSSTEYVYYHTGRWVISQYLCHDRVFMQVQDGALYPYDVTGSWIEHTTAGSRTSSPDVRCTTLQSNGSGRDVIGGSVLAVVLLCWIIMD